MSPDQSSVTVVVSTEISAVKPGIDEVNAQLKAMAEKAKVTSGETFSLFDRIPPMAERASQQTQKATSAIKGMGDAVNQSSGFLNSHAAAIKNASYQLTDFAVQVQGGQSVALAMSQQLPQLLAGMGAFGAVAGLVAAVLPPLVAKMMEVKNASEVFKNSLGELKESVGEVGKTAKEFKMDKLYEEYNKANAATRDSIIQQVKFQQTLIETQRLLAQQALGKKLDGLGDYSGWDKLKGSFGSGPAAVLAKDFGIDEALAREMLPAIKGLRDGSEDAANFMARFGAELAKSGKGPAQDLIKDLRQVVDAERDALAAQTSLSEARQKMATAGSAGKIDLEKKAGKAPVDADLSALSRLRLEARAGDAGLAPQTMKELDALSAAQKKLNLSEEEYLRLAGVAMANDPVIAANKRAVAAEVKAQAEAQQYLQQLQAGFNRSNAAKQDSLQILPESVARLNGELRKVDEAAEGMRIHLSKMLGDGKLSAQDFATEVERLNAAVAGQKSRVAELNATQDEMNQSWEVGAQRAMVKYADSAKNAAATSEQAFTRAFGAMEDAAVSFAMTSKVNFGNLVNSMIADLIRFQVRAASSQAMGSASGLFGGMFSSLFGNVGAAFSYGTNIGSQQTSMLAAQDAAFFADGGVMTPNGPLPLRKYAGGGVANSPQVAIYAEGTKPEAFVPLEDGRSIPVTISGAAASAGVGNVKVELINQGGQALNASGANVRFDADGLVVRVLLTDVANNGPVSRAMQGQWGLNRAAGAMA